MPSSPPPTPTTSYIGAPAVGTDRAAATAIVRVGLHHEIGLQIRSVARVAAVWARWVALVFTVRHPVRAEADLTETACGQAQTNVSVPGYVAQRSCLTMGSGLTFVWRALEPAGWASTAVMVADVVARVAVVVRDARVAARVGARLRGAVDEERSICIRVRPLQQRL